ncbi:hypothetical protein DPMN_023631 [Dreissena polymorpha]|uniref:HTH psq-type domain-containing protein n=1 Tax=Dreissena polymorpha TaxID=45954 RepID=A0A9D4RAW9_DREPO|nr:hypothetical protein DPMN_023631 [Dreissena polymorpha]
MVNTRDTEEALVLAVEAVQKGLSVRRAAAQFCVPRATLADRVSGRISGGGIEKVIAMKTGKEAVDKYFEDKYNRRSSSPMQPKTGVQTIQPGNMPMRKTSAGTPSDGGGGGGGGGKAVGDDDCDYDKDCNADTDNSDDDNVYDVYDSCEEDDNGDNDDGDCGNYDHGNDNYALDCDNFNNDDK